MPVPDFVPVFTSVPVLSASWRVFVCVCVFDCVVFLFLYIFVCVRSCFSGYLCLCLYVSVSMSLFVSLSVFVCLCVSLCPCLGCLSLSVSFCISAFVPLSVPLCLPVQLFVQIEYLKRSTFSVAHTLLIQFNQQTDIDECKENTDNCSTNAQCHNTPGSFNCTCNRGFKGDGINCSGNDGADQCSALLMK